MKTPCSRLFALAAMVAGLAGASSAMAASTWVFSGTNGGNANTGTYAGNPTSAPDLNINGAYSAGGTGNWTSGNSSSAAYTLKYWSGSGLGMGSDGSSSPNHAIDNNGNTEAVLLNFSSSVALTSIGLGWISGDADISLFRYTGTSAPTLNGTGSSLVAMASAGWELVGNYANLVVDTSANPEYNVVNTGNLGSSWWLVSAYNTNFGTGAGLTQGDDFFKMYAVAGNKCTTGDCGGGGGGGKVPEPGSLALVAAGLLGIVGARRRSAKTAEAT